MVAPSALIQLRFLGKSFDTASFIAGCNDEPPNLPSIYITLASAQGNPSNQAMDQRYSFIEVLGHCASPLDGGTAGETSQLDMTEDQQNLRNKVQNDISSLQRQIRDEQKRHTARMKELETECHAKLRVAEELRPSKSYTLTPSKQMNVIRQDIFSKDIGKQNVLMYSRPQWSPVSDTSTLVEPGDTSGVESPPHQISSDIELELDGVRYNIERQLMDKPGKEENYPKAVVEDLVTCRLHEDLAHDHFPNTKSLSKRKRLPGYRSLKKQRRAANPTIEISDSGDRASVVVHSTEEDLSPASLLRQSTATEMNWTSGPASHKQYDQKQEELELTHIKQKVRLSGQSFSSRPSWILAGRVFTAQSKKVSCIETINQILITDSDRPTSWPRSRRWRKSIGVSVKALTDGFERLTMAQAVHSAPF